MEPPLQRHRRWRCPGPAGGRGLTERTPLDGRIVAGAIAGGIAGAIVFAAFVGLGMLLVNRVANDVPVVVLAIAGAYAGWLLGVVVFGAVRGEDGREERS